VRCLEDDGFRNLGHYECANSGRLAAYKRNHSKVTKKTEQFAKRGQSGLYVTAANGANVRAGTDIPRHDIPDDRSTSVDACLAIQQEEVPGCLVRIIAGDESGSDGIWSRSLQEKQALRIDATVERIKVRNVTVRAHARAQRINQVCERRDVRLMDRTEPSLANGCIGKRFRFIHDTHGGN